ncbi:MAG: hypothetical protein Q7U51_15880, partial [Methanoregula sp.]|nr:hypothetical protein [Methanoregula sp.]
MKNMGTKSPSKQNSTHPFKNPDKPCQNPKFSDVNAIEGNQGHLLGVSLKKPSEICVKKSDPQNAA